MRVFFLLFATKKLSFSAIPFSPRLALHSPQQIEEAMGLIDRTTQQAAEGDPLPSADRSTPSAARSTGVERLTDSNPHPLCSYDHIPYGRTSSPPMVVRPHRRS